jgi:hypothetical protein
MLDGKYGLANSEWDIAGGKCRDLLWTAIIGWKIVGGKSWVGNVVISVHDKESGDPQ